jgi:hypothetical protein
MITSLVLAFFAHCKHFSKPGYNLACRILLLTVCAVEKLLMRKIENNSKCDPFLNYIQAPVGVL